MKNVVLGLAIIIGGFYLLFHLFSFQFAGAGQKALPTSRAVTLPVHIVFLQDITGSAKAHGVEIVSSDVFTPYYEKITRSIELDYGIIGACSEQKFISVLLPAFSIRAPELPNFTKMSFVEKPRLRKEYEQEVQKYKRDSTTFFADRYRRITSFRTRIDSIANLYRSVKPLYGSRDALRRNLYTQTQQSDVVGAVELADRRFNSSFIDGAVHFLIANSDAIDSYGRKARKMKNPATVILVNGTGYVRTSIDSTLTLSLTSTEQAVAYSLRTHH